VIPLQFRSLWGHSKQKSDLNFKFDFFGLKIKQSKSQIGQFSDLPNTSASNVNNNVNSISAHLKGKYSARDESNDFKTDRFESLKGKSFRPNFPGTICLKLFIIPATSLTHKEGIDVHLQSQFEISLAGWASMKTVKEFGPINSGAVSKVVKTKKND